MMMHDASMKSYYITSGEMNMDWIELKAICMWCMSKVMLHSEIIERCVLSYLCSTATAMPKHDLNTLFKGKIA